MTDRLRTWRGLLALLIVPLCLAAAPLLDCPDCGNAVSSRALACPKCGCPIEYVREAAEKKAAEEEARHLSGWFVLAETDSTNGCGVAVQQAEGRFVFLPLHLVAGASSLALSPATTNTSVRYMHLEVADDRPLVRFATDDTNLTYVTVSSRASVAGGMVTASWPAADNGSPTGSASRVISCEGTVLRIEDASAPPCVAAFDSQTNLVGMASSQPHPSQTSILVGVSAGIRWVAAKPGDFRRQTSLLAKAEALAAGGLNLSTEELGNLMAELKAMTWLTSDMARRADDAAAEIMKRQ